MTTETKQQPNYLNIRDIMTKIYELGRGKI